MKSIRTMRVNDVGRVKINFEAPEKSLYATERYDIEIDIPVQYPEKPLECYLL